MWNSKASSLFKIPAELFLPGYPAVAMSHFPGNVYPAFLKQTSPLSPLAVLQIELQVLEYTA